MTGAWPVGGSTPSEAYSFTLGSKEAADARHQLPGNLRYSS